jgi:hypothetical protein
VGCSADPAACGVIDLEEARRVLLTYGWSVNRRADGGMDLIPAPASGVVGQDAAVGVDTPAACGSGERRVVLDGAPGGRNVSPAARLAGRAVPDVPARGSSASEKQRRHRRVSTVACGLASILQRIIPSRSSGPERGSPRSTVGLGPMITESTPKGIIQLCECAT